MHSFNDFYEFPLITVHHHDVIYLLITNFTTEYVQSADYPTHNIHQCIFFDHSALQICSRTHNYMLECAVNFLFWDVQLLVLRENIRHDSMTHRETRKTSSTRYYADKISSFSLKTIIVPTTNIFTLQQNNHVHDIHFVIELLLDVVAVA